MKTIKTQAIITSVRSKADGSLGLTLSTPELTVQEKVLFMELQNLNLDISIVPKDEQAPEHKINTDIEQKTPSQRMRAVLFLLWKQDAKGLDFNAFYLKRMEQIIEQLKTRLEPFEAGDEHV